MKHTFFLLAIILFQANYAQNPQLFENTWYLQNLVIDGENILPPSNDEVQFVDLKIYENEMLLETNVCNNASGVVTVTNSNFIFIDGLAITLSDCDNQTNTLFEGIYFGFFLANLTDPFNYSVNDNGNGDFNLIITSISGNQAIYGNNFLSIEAFQSSQFTIHPNPAKNELFLTSKYSSGNLTLKIFNIEGKLLSTQTITLEKKTTIAISNLKSGSYFLNIEDENGNTEVKRFLKE
jgi:heat shock protein HslJ